MQGVGILCNLSIWSILWLFGNILWLLGIYCGHLFYLMVNWYQEKSDNPDQDGSKCTRMYIGLINPAPVAWRSRHRIRLGYIRHRFESHQFIRFIRESKQSCCIKFLFQRKEIYILIFFLKTG
jgi:hypothetical protein